MFDLLGVYKKTVQKPSRKPKHSYQLRIDIKSPGGPPTASKTEPRMVAKSCSDMAGNSCGVMPSA
jgi:hypothetical protein